MMLPETTCRWIGIVEKFLSGKFWMALAAAACLVIIVWRQTPVDPFVASAITGVITHYFTKNMVEK